MMTSKVQPIAIAAIFARISQQGNITDARKSSFLVSKKVLTLFFFALIQALGYIGSDFVTLETQLLLLLLLGLFKIAIAMSFLGPLACVFVLPLLPRLLKQTGQCIANGLDDLLVYDLNHQVLHFTH